MKDQNIKRLKGYLEDKQSLLRQDLSQMLDDKKEDVNSFVESDWNEQWQQKRMYPNNLDKVLDRIHHQINPGNQSNKVTVLTLLTRIAAILFIPLLVGAIILLTTNNSNKLQLLSTTHQIEIIAPDSGHLSYYLPDSSLVVLNAGASLKLPMAFTDTREVSLEGKAYFDVQKDPNRPFSVKMQSGAVEVLGTKFTAQSANAENMTVTLMEGSVKAKFHNNTQSIILKPDEQLVVNNSSFTVEPINSQAYSQWIDGVLVFKNEPFEQVCKRLAEWYDVEINADAKLYKYTYRGSFENETLEEVCQLMTLSMPINYSITPQHKNKDGSFTKKKVKLYLNQ